MRLEDALKYRRKGYDIKRLGWQYPLNSISNWVKVEDIDADDWGVVRKKVAWPEAWEALQQGKKIGVCKAVYKLLNGTKIISLTSGCELSSVPLWWLSQTDFEIVEDE